MRAMGRTISKVTSAVGDRQYREWLKSLKGQIRRAQAKAAVRVNVELLRLDWGMGRDIAEKRMEAKYGSGFFENLSRDLKLEFPGMEGFSVSNLKYIKRFYLFYSAEIRHQAGDESSASKRWRCDRAAHLQAEEAAGRGICVKVHGAARRRVGIQIDQASASRLQVVFAIS